jgi:hypothetical protein
VTIVTTFGTFFHLYVSTELFREKKNRTKEAWRTGPVGRAIEKIAKKRAYKARSREPRPRTPREQRFWWLEKDRSRRLG